MFFNIITLKSILILEYYLCSFTFHKIIKHRYVPFSITFHNYKDNISKMNIKFNRPSEPPAVPPHRDTTNSLKTRSMETGYNKNRRNSNFKSGSTDRRTLPTGKLYYAI